MMEQTSDAADPDGEGSLDSAKSTTYRLEDTMIEMVPTFEVAYGKRLSTGARPNLESVHAIG